jgi:hypothetical protein
LAFEIDLLYELNTKKIDWTKLVDTRLKHDMVWNSLYVKDSQLATYVKKYSSIFEGAFYYRNKLIHVGLIDFEAIFHGPDHAYGFFSY